MALDSCEILKDGKIDLRELARLERQALVDHVIDDNERRVLREILSQVNDTLQTAEEAAAVKDFRERHGL
jgi:hypothetical protein